MWELAKSNREIGFALMEVKRSILIAKESRADLTPYECPFPLGSGLLSIFGMSFCFPFCLALTPVLVRYRTAAYLKAQLADDRKRVKTLIFNTSRKSQVALPWSLPRREVFVSYLRPPWRSSFLVQTKSPRQTPILSLDAL